VVQNDKSINDKQDITQSILSFEDTQLEDPCQSLYSQQSYKLQENQEYISSSCSYVSKLKD